MAHELEIDASGNAKMFFTGDPCWHGLGTPVKEALTVEMALQMSYQDWDVLSVPVMVNGVAVPGYMANVRSTDGRVLGIVSSKYKPVMNREGFAFLDDILKNSSVLKIASAGCLFDGRVVWILAELPSCRILGDEIVPYIVFSNGHDGKHPVSVAMTPTRVVCNNTLTAALKGARRSWSFRHMGDIESRKREASETLQLANQYTEGLTEFAEKMGQKKISSLMLTTFMDTLFPMEEDSSDRVKRNVDHFRNQFLDIYINKPDLQNMRGTAWGLYNAAGDFTSHIQPARKTANYQEGVFASFIDGNKVLDRAQELITTMCG
jgi:phage/plasmid-like protein (TIGR03299 family)